MVKSGVVKTTLSALKLQMRIAEKHGEQSIPSLDYGSIYFNNNRRLWSPVLTDLISNHWSLKANNDCPVQELILHGRVIAT